MTDDTNRETQPAAAGRNTETDLHPGPKPRISEDTLNLFRIILCLALLFPIIQLYFTIPSAISMWVADQFVPFVNMVYFIIVIAGGIWLLRYTFRFSEEERRRTGRL
jgi:hypothetical protein